jgi:predicted RNase H-like HicB family nuclease
MTTKQTFTVTVWQEDDWWIAQCLEVDVSSQGQTEHKARANLKEALELHFDEVLDNAQVIYEARKTIPA